MEDKKMNYQVWDNLAHKYNRLWVQKYSLGPTRREVLKILLPLLEKNGELKILDIGCGTGQLVKEISKSYPKVNYLGIDVAENMISIAKESNEGENINFLLCPIEHFQTDEKYDVVVCTHAFPYFPDKQEVLNKIALISKEGAQVILVNSSTNSVKDGIINFFLKATTSKAKYLSIKKMHVLFQNAQLKVKATGVIRERFYMPTIALFHLER